MISPYSSTVLEGIGATEKKIVIELLKAKINGFGVTVAKDNFPNYQDISLLSGLKFGYDVDEALFVYLTSDHVPVRELERPRSLNILFADTDNQDTMHNAVSPLSEKDIQELMFQNVRTQFDEEVFSRAFRTR